MAHIHGRCCEPRIDVVLCRAFREAEATRSDCVPPEGDDELSGHIFEQSTSNVAMCLARIGCFTGRLAPHRPSARGIRQREGGASML